MTKDDFQNARQTVASILEDIHIPFILNIDLYSKGLFKMNKQDFKLQFEIYSDSFHMCSKYFSGKLNIHTERCFKKIIISSRLLNIHSIAFDLRIFTYGKI